MDKAVWDISIVLWCLLAYGLYSFNKKPAAIGAWAIAAACAVFDAVVRHG